MKRLADNQAGVVLPVSLFILLIVTLLVVSSVNTTNTGLQLALNQQSYTQTSLLSQQAIQQTLSDIGNFRPAGHTDTTWEDVDGNSIDERTSGISGGGFTTVVNKPVCIGVLPVPGYSTQIEFPPERVFWEFSVETDDALTGARNLSTQGVRIRMLNGSCTPL